MTADRPPLPALTGIRFFAAIHVVLFHYAPGMPAFARNIVANGYMAVGFFFILSGFVLAYSYSQRKVEARRFWTARFARIYPAYLAAFLLIAPAVVMRNLQDPGKLAAAGLAAAGLFQAWIPGLSLVWNGPGWSLSNEAFFYLLFPFVLPLLAGLGRRGLWMVCGISWLAALLPQLVLNREIAAYFPLFRLGEFVLGVAAGILFLNRRRVPGWLLPATIAVLAGYLTFASSWVPAGLRGAIAAPLFAMLVYALADPRGGRQQVLAWGPLNRLGEASYAIYILQSPVMAYWLLVTQGAQPGGVRTPMGWAGFLVYTAMLIAISLLCHSHIERPLRTWTLTPRASAPRGAMAPGVR